MRKKMDDDKRLSIKEMILGCARDIVESEGFEGLSIRKVAKRAGYTPGSIYQYFDDKDTLKRALINEGYEAIMRATMKPLNAGTIREEVIERFKAYTHAALRMPQYYKAVMLSDDPLITSMTRVLGSETGESPKSIKKLESLLEQGVNEGVFRAVDTNSYAQILWTANFGLTLRLITENPRLDEHAVDRLVENALNAFFDGIENKKETKNNEDMDQ